MAVKVAICRFGGEGPGGLVAGSNIDGAEEDGVKVNLNTVSGEAVLVLQELLDGEVAVERRWVSNLSVVLHVSCSTVDERTNVEIGIDSAAHFGCRHLSCLGSSWVVIGLLGVGTKGMA